MDRYSAQIRNTILKKLLPLENRTAASLAREYNIAVTTIYGWKAKMKYGTLQCDDGVLSESRAFPCRSSYYHNNVKTFALLQDLKVC